MKQIFMQACVILCCVTLLLPSLIFAQPKPLRELATSYPLGGSSSYFWTAYRAGSFEKHGLKLNPVFIPGGVTALQSLMAKELFIQLTAGPAAVRAWARGGKEITFIGAVGNRLDYVLVTVPSVQQGRGAERKEGRRKPARGEPRLHRTARA
jgi:ABC-type nitrate/sulfonate/bicarbonate transport system substrate-binding protein